MSAIYASLSNVGILHGWQWLFLVEGIPAAIVGFVVLGLLSDQPDSASWLDAEEKRILIQLLARDQSAQSQQTTTAIQALKIPRVWLFGLMYFALLIGLYGFNFWLLQIIQHLGLITHREIGVLTVLPNFVAAMVMYGWARHSDAMNERRWHFAVPAVAAALGLAVASQVSQPIVVLIALTLGAVGIYATLPIFWTLPLPYRVNYCEGPPPRADSL